MPTPDRLDRREAMRWMAAAGAAMGVPAFGVEGMAPRQGGRPSPPPTGYGTDPELNKIYQPGAFWPLTLDEAQRKAVTALCDVILPEDERSPAASAVGVPAFVDEWISAPYPHQRAQSEVLLPGLTWLDEESARRFGAPFAELDETQQHGICDDVCYAPKAAPEHADAAKFFAMFRDLAAAAYYSTRIGMADVGYVGNTPQPRYDGPPEEVRRKAGL